MYIYNYLTDIQIQLTSFQSMSSLAHPSPLPTNLAHLSLPLPISLVRYTYKYIYRLYIYNYWASTYTIHFSTLSHLSLSSIERVATNRN